MHFNYQINRLTTTKVDSTYLGSLANNTQGICPVAGLERMTTRSVAKRLTLSRHTGRHNEHMECLWNLKVFVRLNMLNNIEAFDSHIFTLTPDVTEGYFDSHYSTLTLTVTEGYWLPQSTAAKDQDITPQELANPKDQTPQLCEYPGIYWKNDKNFACAGCFRIKYCNLDVRRVWFLYVCIVVFQIIEQTVRLATRGTSACGRSQEGCS